jgi:hypothetical protein
MKITKRTVEVKLGDETFQIESDESGCPRTVHLLSGEGRGNGSVLVGVGAELVDQLALALEKLRHDQMRDGWGVAVCIDHGYWERSATVKTCPKCEAEKAAETLPS